MQPHAVVVIEGELFSREYLPPSGHHRQPQDVPAPRPAATHHQDAAGVAGVVEEAGCVAIVGGVDVTPHHSPATAPGTTAAGTGGVVLHGGEDVVDPQAVIGSLPAVGLGRAYVLPQVWEQHCAPGIRLSGEAEWEYVPGE